MKELLESWIPWKYYISLVGQDFPLYDNKQIVIALQRLNNLNSIKSYPMPKHNEWRTKFVFKLRGSAIYNSSIPKSPPPHRIALYKGSTHIVAIREFVEFGKDFTEYLKDTYIPDETLYASLQQHPLAPGGIHGDQPTWIPRALQWARGECHGAWVPGVFVGFLSKICDGYWDEK